MIWGIVGLILLLIIIGLVVWLLLRTGTSPAKARVNQPCRNTTDCTAGLVCAPILGVTGTVIATATTGFSGVCKVPSGGVCIISTDCVAGQNCVNNICTTSPSNINGGPCPCGSGLTCVNNVCRAVNGQVCTTGAQCASGNCQNNICVAQLSPTGMTGHCYDTTCYTTFCDTSNDTSSNSRKYRRHRRYSDSTNTSKDSRDSYSKHSKDSYSTKTSKYSKDSKDSYSKNSRDSNDSYSKDSRDSYSKDSYSKDTKTYSDSSGDKKRYQRRRSSSLNSVCTTGSENTYDTSNETSRFSKHKSYLKRGVYVTTATNTDRTLFTGIDKPIIDIVQQGSSTANFYLLLSDGTMINAMGIRNTMLSTNKRMFRIVRFGTEVIGLDKKGRLYSRNAASSTDTYWVWERLTAFPKDVIFINSTNNYSHLEVLTSHHKAYLYAFSSTWKDATAMSCTKRKDFRFYGQDLNRWIDINESTNVGKTNDGVKYSHLRAAGFYNKVGQTTGEIVQVLDSDSFSHCKIIGSSSYFLFLQDC